MAEAWSGNESGMTCNAIAPGFFKTGMTAPLFTEVTTVLKLTAWLNSPPELEHV
jgi:NAD(P)-dependent dehydrogenase (short-subunit alcohol dehydrogenase family)